MSDNETVPMDATAMQAEEIVRAALGLVAYKRRTDDRYLYREEWKLVEAVEAYGTEFKGLRGH